MAISVFFRKVADTPTQVTYELITDPKKPRLTLEIDKAAEPRDLREIPTGSEQAAYRAIMAHYQRTGEWLETGNRQS